MAAAASESFSGRLETEVTSIFINASRSISMTSTLLVEEALVVRSAAKDGRRKPDTARNAAHRFHRPTCSVNAGGCVLLRDLLLMMLIPSCRRLFCHLGGKQKHARCQMAGRVHFTLTNGP